MSDIPAGRFGRFRLQGAIGRGGLAEALLAVDPAGGGRVVLRLLHPHFKCVSEVEARFLGDARLSMRLDHPGIVRPVEAGTLDGRCYTVAGFVDGIGLDRLLVRTGAALPAAAAVELAVQICHALAHAHACRLPDGGIGVVHGDLTPRNVLIDRQGRVRLIDFSPSMAKPGGGTTKDRASPEQIDGAGRIDHRSDLYQLGLILGETLTGHPPAGVPARFDLPAGLPEGVKAIVTRLLAVDPKDRPGSADEVLGCLLDAAAGLPGPDGRAALAALVEPVERG